MEIDSCNKNQIYHIYKEEEEWDCFSGGETLEYMCNGKYHKCIGNNGYKSKVTLCDKSCLTQNNSSAR